ncbi:MAG TPA: thioredoxin domain-containing protein [Verrucomicrobiae bacterium]|nr:thioredoxin domain-containing protein [Verrucomicrobiae bacterium]
MSPSRPANRLAAESSPYLLQHAHNPVDWYPWSPEAFDLARREDKPVLLSVGYSACHWCHVMERESFENDEIAALMNRLFVSIKVDREERPDVDQIYMQAVQSMTGRGGWPMTVFLTPDGVPFYGGTYFPPEDRHGMPAFPRLLRSIADAYHSRRGEVLEAGRQLVEAMGQSGRLTGSTSLLTRDVLVRAYMGLGGEFDERDGGLGQAPKFPQPMTWEAVLRIGRRVRDARGLEMLQRTLTRMARGGIYDQLGGGFHRYSVDGQWLVPHFEKMLYDNAQLASLYLHGWLATGDGLYRRVVEETLDYVRREMTHPAGGFYSAQDADSEGVEGKFFVWSPDEMRAVLGDPALARVALAYWGLDDGPNFEGHSILFVPREPAEVAASLALTGDALTSAIERARALLYAEREKRVHPGLDDKVLASWNGLTLAAFAEAAAVLGRADYLAVAVRNAEFLTRQMVRDGRLLRSWKDGQARITGYLEDYSMVGAGLLALYEATFDRRWLDESRRLAEEALRLFWSADRETFFDTGHDQEALVVRPRNLFDNAVPSGTSVAIDWLLRLAVILGEERYQAVALAALRPMADLIQRYPSGFGRYLSALDFHLGPVAEVALVWPRGQERALAPLLDTVFGRYQPNRVVVGAAEGDPAGAGLPLLAERAAVGGRPTAYVCQHYVCQLPVTQPDALARLLDPGV